MIVKPKTILIKLIFLIVTTVLLKAQVDVIGNKFFTGLCNLLFKLKITDVLFTYVMGSTKAFKELNMTFNDFSKSPL